MKRLLQRTLLPFAIGALLFATFPPPAAGQDTTGAAPARPEAKKLFSWGILPVYNETIKLGFAVPLLATFPMDPADTVSQRSAFVQTVAGRRAGVRRVIPLSSYDPADGSLRLLKLVEPGWWQVTERSQASKFAEKDLRRDVVPRTAIETRVKFRVDNYPKALASMGGRAQPRRD